MDVEVALSTYIRWRMISCVRALALSSSRPAGRGSGDMVRLTSTLACPKLKGKMVWAKACGKTKAGLPKES